MPPITPEFVAFRTGAMALMHIMGRKDGNAFLRKWLDIMEDEETILAMRGGVALTPSERGQMVVARRAARAWLLGIAPSLIASLPPR